MRVFAYVLAAVGSLVVLAGGYALVVLIAGAARAYPGSVHMMVSLLTLNLLTGGGTLCGLATLLLRRRPH